ncbi:MAG: threonine/serine exporter family protein [Peptoniphilaceae bacterium]|nr:threonine/serine exporter family protein [Peptoniphilaceae bacterium]MDY3987292.1 threonine/serine exporter family protein [Peptoniphilaceae bacterium]MDY4196823.1 threonine/serine exporter family protein [Peptoniphilaceae bacterium]
MEQISKNPALSERERKILDIALYAGEELMESGAETNRVEDTVSRILSLANPQSVHVVALLTGLYVSFTTEEGEIITAVRRIFDRRVDLDNIQIVNATSRRLAEGDINPDQARQILKEREHKTASYAPWWFIGLSGAGFTMMLQGGILEIIIAGLCSLFSCLTGRILIDQRSDGFVPPFLNAFIIVLFIGIFHRFLSFDLASASIGSLISFFPGTTFTNGIRDTMRGNFLTAAGNLLSALITAMALAVGAGFALLLTGGSFF